MVLSASKIKNRNFTLGIVGLGYVGLPLSISFLRKNIKVYGFDVDQNKIDILNQGKSYLQNFSNDEICDFIESKKFIPTIDFSKIKRCDAIMICVPTPLTTNNDPDLSHIISTSRVISRYLQPNTLVVLESTSWPGTTDEIVKPILEDNSNLKVGKNLYLCFSPEREDPGNEDFATTDIPKLIGGSNDESLELGKGVYSVAFKKVISVSSNKVAEATKLYENIFRSVNIALVNESKIIFDKMGIDIWEVIKAASSKPFGFMPFYPGPGPGGHCIPVDPFYLTWKAKEYGIRTSLIELSGVIHKKMPAWIVDKIANCLNENEKPIKHSKILVVGIAYKPNVADTRESPSLEIIKILREKKADVEYYDPLFAKMPITRKYESLQGMVSTEPSSDFDCFVIVTPHRHFDPEHFLSFDVPIVDTRNSIPKKDKVFSA